jgi:hypothetical protein
MTTDTATFSDEALREAEKWDTLGPAYFEARPIVAKHMEKFQAEHFQPLIAEFVKSFQDKLWYSVRDHLLSDTEMNLHGEVYRMVDACVAALLSGEKWAIERYVLGAYRQEEIRAAIARHIPQELQDTRIADLEAEVERLKRDINFYRNR